jgi:hypothetical protein
MTALTLPLDRIDTVVSDLTALLDSDVPLPAIAETMLRSSVRQLEDLTREVRVLLNMANRADRLAGRINEALG